ncbi:unnamed protein product, partial [Scytosiphon promiscuus]
LPPPAHQKHSRRYFFDSRSPWPIRGANHMEEKSPLEDATTSSTDAADQGQEGSLTSRRRDNDVTYYKQQADEQRDVIDQLSSLLETYGYHLPQDAASLKEALQDHLARRRADEEAGIDDGFGSGIPPPSEGRRGILLQGSTFMRDKKVTNQEKFEQLAEELPQLVGDGCEVRVKGLGYSVQRPKGTTDEPTV